MKDFTATAKAKTEHKKSALLEGKQKIKGSDVVSMYPEGITIYAFDIINTKKGPTPAVCFKENPGQFFFASKVLADIISDWMDGYETPEECSGDLAAQGGVKVILKNGTTKSGNNIIYVDIA